MYSCAFPSLSQGPATDHEALLQSPLISVTSTVIFGFSMSLKLCTSFSSNCSTLGCFDCFSPNASVRRKTASIVLQINEAERWRWLQVHWGWNPVVRIVRSGLMRVIKFWNWRWLFMTLVTRISLSSHLSTFWRTIFKSFGCRWCQAVSKEANKSPVPVKWASRRGMRTWIRSGGEDSQLFWLPNPTERKWELLQNAATELPTCSDESSFESRRCS